MADSTFTGQYYYSAGKRKSAIARVKLYQNGSGKVLVNGMEAKEYFDKFQVENALAPLALLSLKSEFNIQVKLVGGGKSAQSDAMRLGISRALLLHDAEARPTLKREGYLRRDARIKERKKPGLKGARRAPQFSKR